MTSDDHGSREITPEDRKRAIVHELIHSEPVLNITPGMWQAIRQQKRRRSWWRRILGGKR